ncbi:MAG TPA: 3-hydroxyacyl-CoA dehydrogenase/enoyl-CoA hydratase family protein [Saprospiraceae bacterium]|nr:3-hydroxyacyl-CoA dehydrogenase/enoyl-CoA hydratase family protein [Saprospiraceae bacterium]
MSFRIKKATVLGSGIMGSGIACHLANIGVQVHLLDLPGKEEKNRNAPAAESLAKAVKSSPALLYDKKFASNITVGNFEDHLPTITDSDWIIEVVVEKAEIKQALYEQVEKYRKPGTLITTNTSGIPISLLAEGRSADFKKHFCGTHFFNPVRYMALLEIIPHAETDQTIVDFFMSYGTTYMGKKTVLCKDTPAFIANRIGFFSGNKINELTQKYELRISEVDKLTSDPIGWPSTGSYRLLDLVGLDTSVKVTQGVIATCPDDEYVKQLAQKDMPPHTRFLLDNQFLGNKSGQGYYKKTKEKDENGRTIVLELDLNTLEYIKTEKPKLQSLALGKKIELVDKRIKEMIHFDDAGGRFLEEYFAGLFAYTANRVPEISDNLYSIDDAMKSGYAWGYGPFEYWDMFGLQKGAQMLQKFGHAVPEWVQKMLDNGLEKFYQIENGIKKYYDLTTAGYLSLPNAQKTIHLDFIRENSAVYKNSECVLHDLGDGVLCLEFTSKANAIGEGIGMGVMEALKLAEEGSWKGVVIGNNAKNFTVGANLMAVGMEAMQKNFDKLETMVDGFQQINMAMRYAKIPVVVATQGYCFGGGVEMLVHADAGVCAAETYMGLVEVGVGLIPGGGGTKEFALRASDSFFEGDTQIPTLIEKLRTIATAAVATSAHEGFNLGYLLKNRDSVCLSTEQVLYQAKAKVLALAENYTAPAPKVVTVLGRTGLATLYTAINEFYLGKYMSDYDVEISRKVAYVLCGGDLTGQQKVSEQYLLDIEREAFLQLLGNQKTLDRIQYMLINNKPLRN